MGFLCEHEKGRNVLLLTYFGVKIEIFRANLNFLYLCFASHPKHPEPQLTPAWSRYYNTCCSVHHDTHIYHIIYSHAPAHKEIFVEPERSHGSRSSVTLCHVQRPRCPPAVSEMSPKAPQGQGCAARVTSEPQLLDSSDNLRLSGLLFYISSRLHSRERLGDAIEAPRAAAQGGKSQETPLHRDSKKQSPCRGLFPIDNLDAATPSGRERV